MKITVLCGGVGASRFLKGFKDLVNNKDVTAIINTGDDIVVNNLYISPDIDIVTYTLAEIIDEQKGWGIQEDSFNAFSMLKSFGNQSWFNLGDKDLGTHIYRTDLMYQGKTLGETTKIIADRLKVDIALHPMSNQRITTMIACEEGNYTFQEFLIKHRSEPKIKHIYFEGIEKAQPAQGVIEAIQSSELILFAPSNPFVSIGSILEVKGIKEAIQQSSAIKIGVSPIINGNVIKGPASKMLLDLGHESSALGVAKLYKGLLDAFIIDTQDSSLQKPIEQIGLKAYVTPILINTDEKKVKLAETVLHIYEVLSSN